VRDLIRATAGAGDARSRPRWPLAL